MRSHYQKKVAEFMKKNKIDNPIEYRMMDLFDEVGEVAKEISKMSDYGLSKPSYRKEIEMELGDAFYSLITVANYYKIDLEEVLDLAIKKYQKRINKNGHCGSEND